MGVTTTKTNKPLNPRGNDQSPLAYNRAKLYSGKALDFDGVNDYVDLAGLTFSGNNQSFAFYLKADAWNNFDYIFDIFSNRFIIGSNPGNNLSIYDGTSWQSFSEIDDTINTNFFVVTIEGTTSKAYLNGVQFGSNLTISLRDFSAANECALMSQYDGAQQFFPGKMSGFKAFDVALTAAQVADLYNNPEKVVPTGVDNTALKLWLPMMEGAGTTAYDGSGNGNHGTISGATYVNGVGAPVAQSAVMDWNKSYYFDGVDDSFTTGTYQALGDRTITLSFYSSDYSMTGSFPNTLFAFNTSGGGNTDITRISTDGYIGVYNGSALLGTPTIQVNENELTHVAIVTDAGTETKVYVNGQLSYSTSAWSPSVGASDIFNIGQETDGINISDVWRGFIFNVGVFDSVLTQSEIQAIQGKRYSDLTSAQKTNLVSFYSLQNDSNDLQGSKNLTSTGSPNATLIPQGLTAGRDLLGNLFENVRKQGALNLDGNSWAEVHDNASLDFGTGSFTLEAWAKAKYTSGGSIYNVIMILGGNASTAPNAAVLIDNSVRPQAMYNNNASVTPAQTTGDWYHIVAAYDETDMFVFINGAQVLQNGRTAVDITNTLVKYIGRDSSTQRYYSDQIAQPRIYNRALTAEEVQRNYNAGKNIYTN